MHAKTISTTIREKPISRYIILIKCMKNNVFLLLEAELRRNCAD